jgi:hypothetical protein
MTTGDFGFGGGCECGKPTCHECAETSALKALIRDDFERTQREVRVPTPEIVWWRAQMRAREEAARTAARPILFTQALAIAALIGFLISVAGRLTLSFPAVSWSRLPSLPPGFPLVPIAVAVGCWLVLAPVAVYLALSRD